MASLVSWEGGSPLLSPPSFFFLRLCVTGPREEGTKKVYEWAVEASPLHLNGALKMSSGAGGGTWVQVLHKHFVITVLLRWRGRLQDRLGYSEGDPPWRVWDPKRRVWVGSAA